MELEVRALMPEDADAARAFLSREFADSRYRSRGLELLDSSLRFEDPEYMALLALDEEGRVILGLVVFGTVVGARSVVKVHALIVSRLDAGLALLEAIGQASERSGERMIVCEIPDDPALGTAAAALEASDYHEEGRVPDFVAAGVALRLLVRPLYQA